MSTLNRRQDAELSMFIAVNPLMHDSEEQCQWVRQTPTEIQLFLVRDRSITLSRAKHATA